MTSHYTRGSVTTQRDFGNVLGRPLDTFFWAFTIFGHRSWPVFEVALRNNVQDRSLQCPSNAPFKIHLAQNDPSKRNPELKTKTSIEVLDITCPPQEPTSTRHCHYKKQSQMVDSQFPHIAPDQVQPVQ